MPGPGIWLWLGNWVAMVCSQLFTCSRRALGFSSSTVDDTGNDEKKEWQGKLWYVPVMSTWTGPSLCSLNKVGGFCRVMRCIVINNMLLKIINKNIRVAVLLDSQIESQAATDTCNEPIFCLFFTMSSESIATSNYSWRRRRTRSFTRLLPY